MNSKQTHALTLFQDFLADRKWLEENKPDVADIITQHGLCISAAFTSWNSKHTKKVTTKTISDEEPLNSDLVKITDGTKPTSPVREVSNVREMSPWPSVDHVTKKRGRPKSANSDPIGVYTLNAKNKKLQPTIVNVYRNSNGKPYYMNLSGKKTVIDESKVTNPTLISLETQELHNPSAISPCNTHGNDNQISLRTASCSETHVQQTLFEDSRHPSTLGLRIRTTGIDVTD